MTLLNMYAPTEDKADIEKEKFYDDLQIAVDRTPKSNTILVLGDANAKLGKEDTYEEVRAQIRTWNKSNLMNPFKLQEYRTALHTKLMRQTQHQDVEQ